MIKKYFNLPYWVRIVFCSVVVIIAVSYSIFSNIRADTNLPDYIFFRQKGIKDMQSIDSQLNLFNRNISFHLFCEDTGYRDIYFSPLVYDLPKANNIIVDNEGESVYISGLCYNTKKVVIDANKSLVSPYSYTAVRLRNGSIGSFDLILYNNTEEMISLNGCEIFGFAYFNFDDSCYDMMMDMFDSDVFKLPNSTDETLKFSFKENLGFLSSTNLTFLKNEFVEYKLNDYQKISNNFHLGGRLFEHANCKIDASGYTDTLLDSVIISEDSRYLCGTNSSLVNLSVDAFKDMLTYRPITELYEDDILYICKDVTEYEDLIYVFQKDLDFCFRIVYPERTSSLTKEDLVDNAKYVDSKLRECIKEIKIKEY